MTKQFYVIGHRGAPALAPENTLSSFSRAIEARVHGIELDVHTVDRQLVVIHDEFVDRTSNSTGALQDFSFDALRQLDFGNGATIPTLDEVIDATPTHILINVELKGQNTGRAVAQVISSHQNHMFMISSFKRHELVAFNDGFPSSPNVEIALLGVRLTTQLITEANQLGASSLNVSSKFLQKKSVVRALQRGFRVYVYTVNSARRATQLRDIGVSGVFTDNPARLQNLL